MNPEHVLPHNLEAERALLGAILLHHEVMFEAEGLITADEFYRAAHQVIFRHMAQLAEKRIEIDFVTLKNALNASGQLDAVDGPAYIAALVDGVPRAGSIAGHAQIIREKARLRALIYGANKMLARAYESTDEASEILSSAEQDIVGLADRTVARGFESMRSIASRGLDYLEQAHRQRTPVNGVPSGFADLDEITRGFQSGTLITIGARPGIGKSSLVNNIAQHAALNGKVAAVFSLEMDTMELFVRQVASLARVDSHRLQTGFIGEREWARISQAIGTLSEAPLHIDETPAITLLEVRSRARRLKVEHGLDLLVIDYLQLMQSHQKVNNRALEIGAITGALKALSKELKIPILVASQLSRKPEERGGAPKLSDLRDSGSIEQDSDIVLFLHRDEEKLDEPTKLIVAKHRGGPVGTINLAWIQQFTRYENCAPQYEDQRLPVGDR